MSQGNERWWEFYFIRYAMGTVIGAVIVFQIFSKLPVLNEILFLPEPKNLEIAHILIFASYGLAYCYLASVPILAFHAARFFMATTEGCIPIRRVMLGLWITLLWLLLGSLVTIEASYLKDDWISVGLALFIAFGVGVATVGCLAAFSVVVRSKEIYQKYIELSEKRSVAVGGIIDSYRHLREHGNSFFIVALEIVFGFFLYSWIQVMVGPNLDCASDIEVVAALATGLLVWIIPGVIVWVAATALERQFIECQQ